MDFELILFLCTLVTGIGYLVDVFWWRRRLTKEQKSDPELKLPWAIDYSRSLFPIFLIVLLLRSFLYEPFRIPTGSLEPTLLVGDFILVNKYDYGLRLPVWHKKIAKVTEPKRGDIMVFRYPDNPHVDYIKRVIGLPGDEVAYINKVLYVNGEKAPQEFIKFETNAESRCLTKVEKLEEDFMGIKHGIYQCPTAPDGNFTYTVPDNQYFVMGDNRDDSADSRSWGTVPDENIIGKASIVWLSWDSNKHWFRWNRFGKNINA